MKSIFTSGADNQHYYFDSQNLKKHYFITKDGNHKNEAIQFSAQLTAVEKESRMGTIGFSEASQQRNRISYGVLSLLDMIKTEVGAAGAGSNAPSTSEGIKNQFNNSTFNGPVTFNDGKD